jgi:hypothetical protein
VLAIRLMLGRKNCGEKKIGASCLSMVGNKACSPREGMKEALRPDQWNIIIYQISKTLCLHFIGMT